MDTYPKKPNAIEDTTIEFKTDVVKFGRGYEQRSAAWLKGKKAFTLRHMNLTLAERSLLESFFEDREGGLKPFWFVNHNNGVTYQCVFAEDKLTFTHNNAKSFNLTVKIKEDPNA